MLCSLVDRRKYYFSHQMISDMYGEHSSWSDMCLFLLVIARSNKFDDHILFIAAQSKRMGKSLIYSLFSFNWHMFVIRMKMIYSPAHCVWLFCNIFPQRVFVCILFSIEILFSFHHIRDHQWVDWVKWVLSRKKRNWEYQNIEKKKSSKMTWTLLKGGSLYVVLSRDHSNGLYQID